MRNPSGGIPRRLTVGLVLLGCLGVMGGLWGVAGANVPGADAPEGFATPPLPFEANVGQVAAPVHFFSRGAGYGVWLTPTEAILMVQRPTPEPEDAPTGAKASAALASQAATLRFQFEGTDGPASPPRGRQPLPGQSHYFLGSDPTQWHTHVPQYAQVVYADLYPGIDLIYYGRGGQLEYDLVVAPGANPDTIALTIAGAEHLTLTPDGALEIQTAVGTVRQHKPVIYQTHEGRKTFIPGAYRVTPENQVRFAIAAYDPTRPLYIDPVLSYATYVETEGVAGLTRDAAGNLYLTGAALPSFSPVQAVQNQPQGFRDAYVMKLDPTGQTVLYATYLGGRWDDLGRDLAVDAAGQVTMVGISSSPDFPTVQPLQAQSAGSYDVVVARLSPTGDALTYATYLGGRGEDGLLRGLAVALDAQGHAVLSGTTNSPDFPTHQALQPTYGGAVDAFVAKVHSTDSALLYATYLGGRSSDYGGDVAVDAAGAAYVVGTTFSTDFPTVAPLQAQLAGERDVFVSKLTPDGQALVYATYLGGSAQDEGHGLAVDARGQVVLTGHTYSTDYPVVKPAQASLAGRADILISQLDAAGATLLASTYVGGRGVDQGRGLTLDAQGHAYVTGSTASADFPLTANAAQRTPGMAGVDAIVLALSLTDASVQYATYLGGDGDDIGHAITVDASQTIAVGGTTTSSDLPRTAPLQAFPAGGFVAHLSETAPGRADLTLTITESADPVERGAPLTYTMTVANQGPESATGGRSDGHVTCPAPRDDGLGQSGPLSAHPPGVPSGDAVARSPGDRDAEGHALGRAPDVAHSGERLERSPRSHRGQ